MFKPGDDQTPPFEEPWQAQALALADTLVTSGQVTPVDWADALGAKLRAAEAADKPDTPATYFEAVVAALEVVSAGLGLTKAEQDQRRQDWAEAYRRTPHGAPVELGKGAKP